MKNYVDFPEDDYGQRWHEMLYGNQEIKPIAQSQKPISLYEPDESLTVYDDFINRALANNNSSVDKNLVYRMMQAESGGRPGITSPAGAQGLLQLMPETAESLGVTDRADPEQNINGAVKLLTQLSEKYNGDQKKILAAYNGGEKGVDQATQQYGDAWLAHLDEFKGINSKTGRNHAEETWAYINDIERDVSGNSDENLRERWSAMLGLGVQEPQQPIQPRAEYVSRETPLQPQEAPAPLEPQMVQSPKLDTATMFEGTGIKPLEEQGSKTPGQKYAELSKEEKKKLAQSLIETDNDDLLIKMLGLGKHAIEGVKALARQPIQIAKGLVKLGSETVTPGTEGYAEELKQSKAAGIDNKRTRFLEKYLGEQEGRKVFDEKAIAIANKAVASKLLKEENIPHSTGVMGFVEDVVRMAPQVAAQVGITAATGGIPGTIFMGAQIAGGKYEKLEKEGVKTERNVIASLADATLQAPLEQIGISKALKLWQPGKVGIQVLKEIAGAGFTEFITENLQKYPEAVTEIWAKTDGKPTGERVEQFVNNWWKMTKEGLREGSIAALMGVATAGAGVAMQSENSQLNITSDEANTNPEATHDKIGNWLNDNGTNPYALIDLKTGVRKGVLETIIETQSKLIQIESPEAKKVRLERNEALQTAQEPIPEGEAIPLTKQVPLVPPKGIDVTVPGAKPPEAPVPEAVKKQYPAENIATAKTITSKLPDELKLLPPKLHESIVEVKTFGSVLRKTTDKINDLDIHIQIKDQGSPQANSDMADAVESFLPSTLSGKKVDYVIETNEDAMGVERGKGISIYKPTSPEAVKPPTGEGKVEPIKAYHGTDADFENFSFKNIGMRDSGDGGMLGDGIYATSDKKYAKTYGKNVIPVDINLKNPLVIEDAYMFGGINPDKIRIKLGMPVKSTSYQVRQELIKQGYDGVVINEVADNGIIKNKEVVALHPSQVVKSNLSTPTGAAKAPEPVKPFEYKTMEEIDEARIPIEKLSREELGKAAENIGKEGEAANLSYESSKTKLDADKEATDYASKLREGLFHEKVTRFRKDKEGVLQPFETTQISKDAPPEAWGMLTGEKGNIADLFTKYPSIKKELQKMADIWNTARDEGRGSTSMDVPPDKMLQSSDNWTPEDVADIVSRGLNKADYRKWNSEWEAKYDKNESEYEKAFEDIGKRAELIESRLGEPVKFSEETEDVFKGTKFEDTRTTGQKKLAEELKAREEKKTGEKADVEGLPFFEGGAGRVAGTEQTNAFESQKLDVSKSVDDYIDDAAPPMGFSIRDKSKSKTNDDVKLPEPEGSEDAAFHKSYKEAHGLPKPKFAEKVKEAAVKVKNAFTRHRPLLDPGKFAPELEILRQLDASKPAADMESINLIRGFTAGFGPKKYDIYEHNMVLPDLVKDIENGLYEGKKIPLEIKDLEHAKKLEANYKKIMEANPDIKLNYDKRQDFWKKLRGEMAENLPFVSEKISNDDRYFHHQVLEHMAGKELGATSSVRLRRKGYLRSRIGSEKTYNTNYLQAEQEVLSGILSQLETAKALQRLKQTSDISGKLQAEAKKAGKKVDDLIPEGYVKHNPYEDMFHKTNTIADNVVEKVLSGERTLTPEDIKTIYTKGKQQEWIIPEKLAKTLEGFKKLQDDNVVGNYSKAAMDAWKQWTLLNPMRVVKYNFNNMSGDLDIAFAYKPSIVFKEGFGAARDLAPVHFKGKAPSEEIVVATKKGVLDSGFAGTEIKDITENKFMRAMTGKEPNLIEQYWGGVKNFTTYRENILRFAAFRHFRKELAAGKRPFAVSKNKEMKGLYKALDEGKMEIDDVAAKLSRDLIGDYGNRSKGGEWLREHAMPFYSWIEINSPRYWRLLYNAASEMRGEGIKGAGAAAGTAGRIGLVAAKKGATLAGKTALKVGTLTAAAAGMSALITVWNHTFFPDEEKEMGLSRRELHLILGRNKETGEIKSVRFQGALSDMLDFVGMSDVFSHTADVVTGKATIGEKAKEAGEAIKELKPVKSFASKLVNALGPQYKLPVELITKRTAYPDVSRPRAIRDRGEYVAKTFSVELPYRIFSGKPLRGIKDEVMASIVYKTDPGEAAYFEARQLAMDFLRKKGEDTDVFTPSNKSNALYYYKKAITYKDDKAADRWLKRYKDLGGNERKMNESIRNARPMMATDRKHRAEFLNSLSKEEIEIFDRAEKWYNNIYYKK